MNLHRLLQQREAAKRPLRVALAGAGKFGSMFLAQARVTPGIHIVAIGDLAPDRAQAALRTIGWPVERTSATSVAEAARHGTTYVTDDALRLIAAPEVESSSTRPAVPPPASATRSRAAGVCS